MPHRRMISTGPYQRTRDTALCQEAPNYATDRIAQKMRRIIDGKKDPDSAEPTHGSSRRRNTYASNLDDIRPNGQHAVEFLRQSGRSSAPHGLSPAKCDATSRIDLFTIYRCSG